MEKTSEHLYYSLYNHFRQFCLTGKECFKDSIQAMEIAIEDTKEDNLAIIYEIVIKIIEMDKSQFNDSWKTYGTSLSKNKEDWWYANSILALTYEYIFFDLDKKEDCKKIVESKFSEINGERKALGKSELVPLEWETSEYVIEKQIQRGRAHKTMKADYNRKGSQDNFRLKQRSYMKILKGFSSSTPFFYDALKERFHGNPIKGGGFFIKWKDNGIVIDPGINFVENFHLAGLTIEDIAAIIITHNHIDHCGDLQTIDDLAAQMGTSKIDIYMDTETYTKFKVIKGSECFDCQVLDCSRGNSIKIGCESDKVEVEYFETEHIKNEKDKDEYKKGVSFGLKLSLHSKGKQEVSIGITSDTRYMDILPDKFKNCDYIIVNFSETDKDDYEGRNPKGDHLGYMGCSKLITECNAISDLKKPIYIISEFWGGLGDIRREIVRSLRKSCGYERIIPGDIDMTYMLDNSTFLCGFCEKEADLKEMKIVKQKGDFSKIELICEDCILE